MQSRRTYAAASAVDTGGDEELTTENNENTVVKQLPDDSSHKIEEFKSGQIPSATHQPSSSYYNYDSQ